MQNRNQGLPEPSFTQFRRRWREQIGAVLSHGEQGALPFALPSRAHWPGGLSRLACPRSRCPHCRPTAGCPRQDLHLRSWLRRPILFAASTCQNTPWPRTLGGVWGEECGLSIPSMRTKRAVIRTGQVTVFTQFSGLRKDTITASEAV
jgi:hypothetical protein